MRLTFNWRSGLKTFPDWIRACGFKAAAVWTWQRLQFPAPETVSLKPRGVRHPLAVRLAGSSDIDVFSQIFREEEYAPLLDIATPRTILDLGANIGCSSAYFLNRFPQARVIAVEPDPRNVALCRRNLAPYGDRAMVIHGAVWPENGTLELMDNESGDEREWGVQVRATDRPDAPRAIPAYDIATLCDLAGAPSIDILKIDIERSEIELFARRTETWLARINNICIELHGPDCEAVFLRALDGFEYRAQKSGELTLCRGLKKKQHATA